VTTLTAHRPLGCQKGTHWTVDQLADLFRTTHTVKTQQVIKSRGQDCGDIEFTGNLVIATGPVPLVLNLRISHDSGLWPLRE
jgi:hypothetical protein